MTTTKPDPTVALVREVAQTLHDFECNPKYGFSNCHSKVDWLGRAQKIVDLVRQGLLDIETAAQAEAQKEFAVPYVSGQGEPCSSCGVSDAVCYGRILKGKPSCCGVCYVRATHGQNYCYD